MQKQTPKHLLYIGDILGAHGLKGALLIFSHTRPSEAAGDYDCWWLGKEGGDVAPYTVRRCWKHGNRILAEIDGIPDRNSAEALKGQRIHIDAEMVSVEDDEFLWDDLIGCEVYDAGELIGTVTALESYGAQDTLCVRTPADAETPGEWLIPFVEDIVMDVDLEAGRIEVRLPEGMDACFTPSS